MELFPHFPLHFNYLAFFGLTILLGLIGGELAKRSYFLPVISGYIAIGFIIGPGCFNIVSNYFLTTAHIFVEISISLILFELGRHLDFRWLYHDVGLLLMAITESVLTFIFIFTVLYFFIGLAKLQAALGATMAIATSPAVVMMVANDLSAEGPVTRRTLILTSINNLFALIIFTLLLPLTQSKDLMSVKMAHAAYRLFGSIALGVLMFLTALLIAWLVGKHKQNQFVLFVGLVLLTLSLSHIFTVSTMLSLFILGVAARNFDFKHYLIEINFGWFARVLFILLFVVTGVHLNLHGVSTVLGAVALFIFIRGIAKMIGVFLFSSVSKLTFRQAAAISFALTPMAGVAIGMSNILIDFNPDFGRHLLLMITGAVTILNLVGPIATQIAFIKTKEALS